MILSWHLGRRHVCSLWITSSMEWDCTESMSAPSLPLEAGSPSLSRPQRADSSLQRLWAVFAINFHTSKELSRAQCLLLTDFYFCCPLLDSMLLVFVSSTFSWILFLEHPVLWSHKTLRQKVSFSTNMHTDFQRFAEVQTPFQNEPCSQSRSGPRGWIHWN